MARQEDLFAPVPPQQTWSLYRSPKLIEPAPPPPDASERERALHVALAMAKRQLHELRARLVRADCVAATWEEVPHCTGPLRTELGRVMRRILSASDDVSLRVARAEWERQR